MPTLDRSAITNIETGRRQRVGVDELLVLALALGVAPLHLLVPLDEEWYAAAPELLTSTGRVRQWIRGNYPMLGGSPSELGTAGQRADREMYLAQQPRNEWTPPLEPTPEQQEQQRQERIRLLLELEEKGDITITRNPGGGWAIEPTSIPTTDKKQRRNP